MRKRPTTSDFSARRPSWNPAGSLRISLRESKEICGRPLDWFSNIEYPPGMGHLSSLLRTGTRGRLGSRTRREAVLPGGSRPHRGGILGWAERKMFSNELLCLFIAARIGPMVILGYKSGRR